VAEGAMVGEILKRLKLPDDLEVGVIVNDVYCIDKKRVMRDGDSLFVVPLITGG
jgi:hypothetical protein